MNNVIYLDTLYLFLLGGITIYWSRGILNDSCGVSLRCLDKGLVNNKVIFHHRRAA